ncbi:hypothetical protein [Pleomorphomonas koreensis]|uniref:hypothetical protein n=1 Tax=Pleomorphomonas koreensis TaxID=257440 RepID=UPI0004067AD2|nr:hypothetical protein [Pleomorphomonas koreensis]
MARGGWRRELAGLGRDVLRVLLAYTLLLPMLVPVALVRAEASAPSVIVHSLCSAMPQAADDQPEKSTVSVDCLICCLVPAAGLPPQAAAQPAPVEVVLPLRRILATTTVRLVPEGEPPPQRAPPRLA